MRKIFFLTLLFVILSAPFFSYAVDIQPQRYELTVKEGSVEDMSFKLSNSTDETMIMSASFGKYRFLLSENAKLIDGKDIKDSLGDCESWLSMDLEKFIINPGETRTIIVKLKVPSKVKGEYAACLLIDTSTPTKTQEIGDNKESLMNIGLEVVYRKAIPIYLFIDGSSEIKGKIKNVELSNMSTESQIKESNKFRLNKIKFAVNLVNLGKRHIRAKGNIIIFDDKRNIVDSLSMGKTLPIFPLFEETIPVYWSSPAKKQSYSCIVTVDTGNENILQTEKQFSVDEKGFLVK